MIITDTHAHIYLPEFADTRKEMLERAEKEGVTKILLPAIDSESHASLVNLAKEFPGLCRPMMGLHPCYVKANYREELKIARDYLEQGGFVAVGEIGLDFYWDKTFTEQQYLAFEEQIRWAMEFDLPIAISLIAHRSKIPIPVLGETSMIGELALNRARVSGVSSRVTWKRFCSEALGPPRTSESNSRSLTGAYPTAA